MTPGPIRVLLVDDEPDYTEMLSLRLASEGLDVQSVGSGKECLRLLNERAFDVIILDLLMPGMSGMETLEALRDQGHGVAVIIMTGHAPGETLERCLELGADVALLKPADFPDLLQAIKTAASGEEA